MQTHHVRFAVSLSDGRTLFEGKGVLVDEPGQKSPWQKLQDILVDDSVKITSFLLFTNNGRMFHLPSAGSKPNFPIKNDVLPIDYNLFRALESERGMSGNRVVSEELTGHYTVAEAIYEDFRIQLWVSEKDTRECRTLIVR